VSQKPKHGNSLYLMLLKSIAF